MATIFTFPDAFERDQMEFDRTGSSSLTRAQGEAALLWAATSHRPIGTAVRERIGALQISVDRLVATRPEAVDDLVICDDGSRFSLSFMPALLRNRAGLPNSTAANDAS